MRISDWSSDVCSSDPPYVGSWFGALPYGDKGALLYGMRGHVFESDDIAALPTEESSTLLSLERQSPDAEVQNVDGRWRQLANPVSESLFGAARVGTSAAVLVGVNASIVRGHLDRKRAWAGKGV